MLRTSKNFVLGGVCLVVVAGVTSAVVLTTRASDNSSQQTIATASSRPVDKSRRNLSLQPEALRIARQLGKRFTPTSRMSTALSGQLSIAKVQQPVSITRRQTESGETVELSLANRALTWNADEGTKTNAGVPTDTERLLLERLILDSPDQFVLAQLRGASYFTVARNVRRVDATDGYSGPLWNLVRVDEPQLAEKLRPLSTWRIYYLNVQTGLPDGVEYQLNGKTIRAEFLEWTEQQGEKTPSRVRWSSDGQPIMEYRATSISLNQ
jgi:hypothetical protein